MSKTTPTETPPPPGWSKTGWGAYARDMYGLRLLVDLAHRGRPKGAWTAGPCRHEGDFSLAMRCVERPTRDLAMGAAEEMAKRLHEWAAKVVGEGRGA